MDAVTLALAKAHSDKKGGYTTSENKEILPLSTYEAALEVDVIIFALDTVLDISAGDKVTVSWNGAKYTCEVFNFEGIPSFGNMGIAGAGDDTGEPFAYSVLYGGETQTGAFLTTAEGIYTVSVIKETETIHPIDPKYLPGVCLPVVEITRAEYPESGVVALSAEESTALTAAAEMNVGAVIRFTYQSSPITIVGHLFLGTMFAETINAPVFRFMRGEDGWLMGVSE